MTNEGLIFKIYKHHIQLTIKIKQLNQKMDRIPEKTFSRKENMDNQQAHEKIFNIIDNQRNMNKNHSELSPPRPERLSTKRQQMLARMQRKKTALYTVDRNINWYSHCGKHEVFLKKLEMQLPCDPEIQPLRYISKGNENTSLK